MVSAQDPGCEKKSRRITAMSFFDTLNERFFNPFCCRNRSLYFACISQLIEKSKEIPVLYETDARDTLILYLQNCQYTIETENIGEEIGSARSPQENASAILRYFSLPFSSGSLGIG